MDDVLESAQKLVYERWPKFRAYDPLTPEYPGYDPLDPSKLNCRAPFFLNILARYCYEKCVRKWRTMETEIRNVEVAFVPVWVCSNYSERKKKNKWKIELLIVKSDENYAYSTDRLPLNNLFVGTIEVTYVPNIRECRYVDANKLLEMEYVYAPIEHWGYYVDFIIVESKVLEVKKMYEIQPEFEKPTIYVPPMCEKIMPAVRTDDLPEALQKLLNKEFDSDCSTYLKRSNWYFDYCSHPDKNFLGIRKRPILPPEYRRFNY